MFGWGTGEFLLLALLLPLLLASGFFSGSETALFGLSESQRIQFRHRPGLVARALDALLADQRMLLITILLGNMTVNVLFFVISSVLMLHTQSVAGEAAVGLGALLGLVLLGEVLPKMHANAHRMAVAGAYAPLLITLHRVIGPIRVVVERLIVAPLARLTSPAAAPPQLTAEELQALLEISGGQGVIDRDEQRLLRDVLAMGRKRVRDVMTPRVRMHTVPIDASRPMIVEIARRTKRTKLPVHDRDLDRIVGILHVKRYLAGASAEATQGMRGSITPPHFVPEMASLEQLLAHFRQRGEQMAIVVDEYGGTAGIVAIEDVVEELVGDIVGADAPAASAAHLVGPGQWLADGDMSVDEWAEMFGQRLVSPRVTTLGGLITERLGRAADVGDVVELGNVRLEVTTVEGARVQSALVTLVDAGSPEGREP